MASKNLQAKSLRTGQRVTDLMLQQWYDKYPIDKYPKGLFFIKTDIACLRVRVEKAKNGIFSNIRFEFRYTLNKKAKSISFCWPKYKVKSIYEKANECLECLLSKRDPKLYVFSGYGNTTIKTVREISRIVLDDLRNQKSKNTLMAYEQAINNGLKEYFDLPITDFNNKLLLKKIIDKAKSHHLSIVIKKILTYACDNDYIDSMVSIPHKAGDQKKITHHPCYLDKLPKSDVVTIDNYKQYIVQPLEDRKNYEFYLFVALHSSLGLRPAETHSIKRTDIDFNNKLLTVPSTKTMKNFIIPLSDFSLKIIEKLLELSKTDNLFNKDTSTYRKYCQTIYNGNQTLHGFRSIFSQWLHTNHNDKSIQIIEMCLSHSMATHIEKTYSRDIQYIEQRRPIMQNWGEFLSTCFNI